MKKDHRKSVISIILKGIAGLILLLVVCVVGYVAYMQIHYYRIEDHAELEVENHSEESMEKRLVKSLWKSIQKGRSMNWNGWEQISCCCRK